MNSDFNIAFITLGCAKNEVDTDKMQALLSAAGFSIVDDASTAHLAIVNTCAFLSSAVEESLEVIFDLVRQQNSCGEKLKVLVAGCMPSRYGSDLSDELTEAVGFLPADQEESVVEIVEQILDVKPSACLPNAKLRHLAPVSAYVKISDGCDRYCSYCMIPYIRGRYHSFSLDQIDLEVSELAARGVKEIILIGQDTGIWGKDFDTPSSITELLSTLAQKYPQIWFRLMYIQPEGITDDLLDTIVKYRNICSYIDMPLQHSEQAILERMNRSGSSQVYLDLIEHIRSKVPDITIRTTLMAAFPGETDKQFEALLEFVEKAQFDYAGVFAYSPEEGSAAYLLDGLIEDDIRYARAQQLMDVCESIGVARLNRLIGTKTMVLVEGFEETEAGLEALCRSQGQAPDIDGQIHVPTNDIKPFELGQMLDVEITSTFFYELEGEALCNE